MTPEICRLRRRLRSAALCSLGVLLLLPAAAFAFNPNEGAVADGASSASPRMRVAKIRKLPSTAALVAPLPKLVFPEIATPHAPATLTNAPSFPPVDTATFARAQQALQASQEPSAPAPLITNTANFAPPAPLVAVATTAEKIADPAPAPMPEPLAASSLKDLPPIALPPIPQPPIETSLSGSSKKILSEIPSKLSSAATKIGAGKSGDVAIKRMSPHISAAIAADPKIETYDSAGISIKVARQGLDTNFELNRAYTALMGGDTSTAIETYKNVLITEPNNQDALFGVGSTYHRQGNLDQARPYYGRLLKLNPDHREGLNNFLALVSDESPQEALAELERLEQRNPQFSPIPAQQAVVFSKLGYHDQAREKMLRAIELAPDNLTYKYNLAVMLDRQGDYADAGALYRLLIDASLHGEKIPSSIETIQKRLNFIVSSTSSSAVGS